MLKVAIVCGAGIVSGKEIMALELAKGLRDKGCEVEVVTSYWGNGEFRRRLRDENLPMHIMRLGFISATLNSENMRMTAHQMIFWPSLLMNYGQFLREIQPDKVIHTNWHHLLLMSPLLRNDRDMFWVHDITPQTTRYERLFRWLGSQLDCFVPVSNAVGESLRQLGVAERKIHVIHSGIEDPVAGLSGIDIIRPLAIGIVGQIGPWKGHEDLLDAFQRVVASFPETELHIFGRTGSEYEQYLRSNATKLGVADKVRWRGFVDDPGEIYGSLDICVVPSRCDEALGMVAIEAGFFSVPVVAARRGGLQEVIEDGETGSLIGSGDIDGLESALKALLSSSTLRERMGKQARWRMIERFGRKRFIGDFFNLLKAT